MIFIFYILACVLIYFSFKSFRGGFAFLKYVRRELAARRSDYAPFATVVAPCKGLDDGLEENLSALIEQEYPDYEVVFVVDDVNDPANAVVKRIINRGDAETQRRTRESSASPRLRSGKIRLVVAPKAVDSSQKVENLSQAVLHASEESQVFAFVDSDARPAKEWLRHLIAPLEDENVGAATGYRWFISKKPTFASELRSVWNASIASALGPNTKTNFCWGGSMAIRRDTFERLGIRDRWRGTLSDDFTVTRAMNEAGLAIRFVPQALTPSVEDCTFRELLEFTTRQMKITQVYASHLWGLSFFGSGLFTLTMSAAFLIVLRGGQYTFAVKAAIATLFLVTIFSIGKAWLRLKAVKLILKDHETEIRRQTLPQLTLWLLAPPLFLYNCVCAALSRRMTWRGIKYELVSHRETTIVE